MGQYLHRRSDSCGLSIDGGILARQDVRHYRIDGPNAKRIDPLALRPRDFVDEWLTHEWKEAAFWSTVREKVAFAMRLPGLSLLHESPLDHIPRAYDSPTKCFAAQSASAGGRIT